MVFLTAMNLVRSRGPDKWWRKRQIFKLSSLFYGRRRNCYKFAVRSVHRALVYATKSRDIKKEDMKELWTSRIVAGLEQIAPRDPINTYWQFQNGLMKNNIQLNRMSLATLAAYEPASFEALAKIAMNFNNNDEEEVD